MRAFWVGCLALAMVGGCTPADREEIASSGQQALGKAYEASATAVKSAVAAASKVDMSSSPVDLQAARDKAAGVLKSLEGINLGVIKEEVGRLKLQVDRIDKAIAEQKLKEKWDAALVQANNGKELAADQIASARASLLKANEEFKFLDSQLQAAKSAYQAACDKIDGLAGSK